MDGVLRDINKATKFTTMVNKTLVGKLHLNRLGFCYSLEKGGLQNG